MCAGNSEAEELKSGNSRGSRETLFQRPAYFERPDRAPAYLAPHWRAHIFACNGFSCNMLPGLHMSEIDRSWQSRAGKDPEDFGHPRGTLAIVAIFGVLFLLGWVSMYVYLFLQRGAPHP